MKRNKIINQGIIALIMATIMFIISVPTSTWKAVADGIKENITESSQEASIDTEKDLESNDLIDVSASGDVYIVDENKRNRTIDSKEFIMSDGSIIEQKFLENIHYFDNGEYKEIDNSLIEKKDETGKTILENKANSFKVKINKELKNGSELIEMSDGGYSLKFSYAKTTRNTIVPSVEGVGSSKEEFNYDGKRLKTPQYKASESGKVTYTDIDENIDLQYIIQNNGLKENIIVNEKSENYIYDFIIETNDLFLEQEKDGSIFAINADGKVKFIIPSPYMYDVQGRINYGVYYELSGQNNAYYLSIIADKAWINNEAKLPVTIDPILESWNDTYFTKTNVYQTGTGEQSANEIYIGEKTAGNISNAYVRFEISPKGQTYSLIHAQIFFRHRTEGMGFFNWKNIKYSASVVDSSMSLSDITYSNKPARLQFLRTIGADVNLASTEQNYNLDIDIHTLKGDVVTFGFEREANNSSGAYVRIFLTGSNATYLILQYKQITGILYRII